MAIDIIADDLPSRRRDGRSKQRRQPRHDILFEPVQIGPKVLKNRFYGVPYNPAFGPGKPHANLSHRAVQAEGGWAAVCTGVLSIAPDFEANRFVETCWDDADAPVLGMLVERIHAHDALAGLEIGHAGAEALNRDSRWAPVGPSQLPGWRRQGIVPKEMTRDDIHRLQQEFVRAATTGARLGFDILVVYGSFSYLQAQFLSPYYNRRTDEYGGSLENRARFWLEVLEAVRDAVGDRCAISNRMAVAGLGPMGIGLEESLRFIEMADDLVDLWDVNVGAEWSRDTGSSRFFPEAHQLAWTGRVREATRKPIVGVGRLNDPDKMAEIIRSGAWDLIGAARPRIADPFLPRKLEAGEYDEVRECTGSNLCVYAYTHGHIACVQNPTAGEEYRRGWHPERVPRLRDAQLDVLVVGAGPAGLECALTLMRRGAHRVHVVDAGDELGGHLRWMTRLPRLGEWRRIVNHRQVLLAKAKRRVTLVSGVAMGTDDILEYGADVVILATGSTWATTAIDPWTHESIPGADALSANVLTPEQIMLQGKRPAGADVVVYDTDGAFVGSALAEELARSDHRVRLVTPHAVVSPVSDETMDGLYLRPELQKCGITCMTATTLTAVADDHVRCETAGAIADLPADATVLVTYRESDDELYRQLSGRSEELEANGIRAVHRAGDCVAPRILLDAVFDGHRLARELDASDAPEVPLPTMPDRLR